MAYNGAGLFVRVHDWTADADAAINIRADRMDEEFDGMATGLSTALTKDGQTTPSGNLPMGTFRHTGVGDASARTHYAVVGQIQDGKYNWIDGGGTADAITATYSPALTAVVDGQLCFVRATAANTTTTPTFAPNGLTARTIVKAGGQALAAGDIRADGHELILRYDLTNTRWELLNPWPAAPGENLLINANFAIDQRNAGASTAVADDVYCFDRWYALTQTAAVNVSQVTAPEDGYTYAMRLTQNQASAQRMGFAQIVEGKDCKHGRGLSGTLVPRIRCSSSQAIRYAILGWTGTEDTVTSDVVADWTNATFTAGNFFSNTTLSVLGVGTVTPAANTWASLTALTASLGSSFTNLIVMVWTEGTAAQNVTLDCDAIKLEIGNAATPFVPDAYAANLAKCLRTYENLTFTAASVITMGNSTNTTFAFASLKYTRKRIVPIVTLPGSGSGAGQAAFFTASGSSPTFGTNTTVPSLDGTSIEGASYTGLTAASPSAFYTSAGCSITISAEL